MIRDATPPDFPAIRAVIWHAFDQADEANLVEQLRDDGDVLVELVEANDIALQGHILYSRLAIERGGKTLAAAALAPVSVLPAFQRRGIGKALLAKMLRDDRAHGDRQSALLATHAGAMLYPHVGYRQLGLLLMYVPKRK